MFFIIRCVILGGVIFEMTRHFWNDPHASKTANFLLRPNNFTVPEWISIHSKIGHIQWKFAIFFAVVYFTRLDWLYLIVLPQLFPKKSSQFLYEYVLISLLFALWKFGCLMFDGLEVIANRKCWVEKQKKEKKREEFFWINEWMNEWFMKRHVSKHHSKLKELDCRGAQNPT